MAGRRNGNGWAAALVVAFAAASCTEGESSVGGQAGNAGSGGTPLGGSATGGNASGTGGSRSQAGGAGAQSNHGGDAGAGSGARGGSGSSGASSGGTSNEAGAAGASVAGSAGQGATLGTGGGSVGSQGGTGGFAGAAGGTAGSAGAGGAADPCAWVAPTQPDGGFGGEGGFSGSGLDCDVVGPTLRCNVSTLGSSVACESLATYTRCTCKMDGLPWVDCCPIAQPAEGASCDPHTAGVECIYGLFEDPRDCHCRRSEECGDYRWTCRWD